MIDLWKAERKRICQTHLDALSKDQEREIAASGRKRKKQEEEMTCQRQKYFDIRSAAEATDGANANGRKDVPDAKAASDASERELNLRKPKLDNGRKALDQLTAKKQGSTALPGSLHFACGRCLNC